MTDREPAADIQVLFASYSRHTKHFHIINENGNSYYLLRLQTEGFCRIYIEGKLQRIGPGDLLLYPAGEYFELLVDDEMQHDGKSGTISADYFIFLRGSGVKEWWKMKRRPFKINVLANEEILTLFRQITVEHRRKAPDSDRMLGWFMNILFVTIDRAITEQPDRKGKAYLAFRIRRYVEENATNPFRLADVARHAGISVSGAVHLFKAAFGQSIMQYALELRLTMARERIIFSTMPLGAIAEFCGFANYTYFHRVFRARYGMSPQRYREVHRKGT